MAIGNLDQMLQDFNDGVKDYTDNGKCSGCGQCCSNLLPLTIREIEDIRRYIAKHEIKECYHPIAPLAYPILDMTCPFLDESKEKNKCVIYKHRPYICRTFSCHNTMGHLMEDDVICRGVRLVTDMRQTFFGKEIRNVAKEA